jgi:hypothetical protein
VDEPRYLRKGSIVTVRIIPGDITVTPGMLNYDGVTAPISRVCRPNKWLRARLGSSYGYELEGIVSEFGIPYTFTNEMIL